MHQAVLARATENPARVANTPFRFIRSCSAPLAPAVDGRVGADFSSAGARSVRNDRGVASDRDQSSAAGRAQTRIGRSRVRHRRRDHGRRRKSARARRNRRNRATRCRCDSGYANNPEANRTSFINGWFRTGDNGRLDRDGYLFITGRIKEIINRGGQKISPREVDEVLCTHPAVANAVAFAIPDHRLGEDVAAAVVLRPGHAASEIEIRNHAATRIAQYKVPRRIVFLDELPKGPTGKLQRIGLAAQLGLDGLGAASNSSSRPNEFVAPSTADGKDARRYMGAGARGRTNRRARRFSGARRRLDAGGARHCANSRRHRRSIINS